MSELHLEDTIGEFTTLESWFVRKRNVLMVRASFTSMFTDYYIHLMEQKIKHPENLDQMMKDFLVVLSLHLVARPWAESIAWTGNLRAPRINIFASGGSTQEAITGRLFTDDVREPDRNYFYSQTMALNMPEPHTTTLEITGTQPLKWIEEYYNKSEQRPCRAFYLGDDDYVIFAAQPGYDEAWLENLTLEQAKEISEQEELNLLETRKLRFFCGCNVQKILPLLAGWKNRLDELFGEQEKINIQCPRCAAQYLVSRGMVEEFTTDPT